MAFLQILERGRVSALVEVIGTISSVAMAVVEEVVVVAVAEEEEKEGEEEEEEEEEG